MIGKAEAKAISKLIKTIIPLLQNTEAKAALLSFAQARRLGPLLEAIERFDFCGMLQKEKVKILTRAEMDKLIHMGIPAPLKSELKAAATDRSKTNQVIKGIQESCANKITLLHEFREFETYINDLATRK